MTRLPQLTGHEIIRRLERLGFERVATHGSHVAMWNQQTDRRTTVPVHGSKCVKTGTLHAIIKQCGITRDDFLNA